MAQSANEIMSNFTEEQISKIARLLVKHDNKDPSNLLDFLAACTEVKRFLVIGCCIAEVLDNPS